MYVGDACTGGRKHSNIGYIGYIMTVERTRTVFRENMFTRCWLDEREYPFGGQIHRASNFDGMEVVRHLCDDKRCINPLHHRQGTYIENGYDRVLKTKFIDEHVRRLIRLGSNNIEYILNRGFADYVGIVIREEKKRGVLDKRSIELAKSVWVNEVLTSKVLVIMDDYFNGRTYERTW